VKFEVDPSDNKKINLEPRGSALSRPAGAEPLVRPGEIFLPVLRRTSRSGQLVEHGVAPVPWTYIEAVASDGHELVGRIHSGSRRPFGVRRPGRTEQVAIALRADPGQSQIRLRSRTNAEKPLVGYEVQSQNVEEETLSRVGLSDQQGALVVQPGKSRVQVLFVKNGGQLLARVPIVPGADRELSLPLPDDDMRLAAEARLSALREELIDVVARRNILIARVKQKIEKRDYDAADKLLRSLDELPGRSQFDLTITTASRILKSDDPQIQRRIDNLFNATRTLLTQFLDMRPINEVHDELNAARQKKS
jgi:hypothetical protein